MVRRCVVPMCGNTDQKVLCHRFPKKSILALKWAKILKVEHISLDFLVHYYTVCCLHFEASAYRNAISKHLNFTAEPTLAPLNPRLGGMQEATGSSAIVPSVPISESYPASISETRSPITLDTSENECISNIVPRDDSSSPQNVYSTEANEVSIPNVCRDSHPDNHEGSSCEVSEQLPHRNYSPDCYESDCSLIEVFDCSEGEDEAQHCVIEVQDEPGTKDVADAVTQVDRGELDRNGEVDDIYSHMTKSELIILLRAQEVQIKKQQQKLNNIQTQLTLLQRNEDALKNML